MLRLQFPSMNVKEEMICRLCLTVAENDFVLIGDTIRKMFEGFLLKVNLDISKDPIICKNCADITAKYFNFKSACMDTKRLTSSFGTGENKFMLKLRNIYKHEKDVETVHDFICRLCSDNLSGSSFVLLYTLLSDVTYMKIFQELIPDMDFEIINNMAICTSCKQNLDCYSKFIEKCLDVDEKITEYIQTEYILSSGQVNLSEILRFSLKNRLELNHNKIAVIKHEHMDEAYPDIEYETIIKTEDMIDIKEEGINYNETACETSSNMPVSKLNTVCVFKTKIENNRIALTQNSSFTPMTANNCALCTHQTKHKGALKRHMAIHKDITAMKLYRCSMCIYETKHKSSLKSHMLIHKDITEVEMYKCSMCVYETKQKGNLKRHMLTHKDITEVEMYKCSKCIYETKRKHNLKMHLLIHKDITEIKMYKCSMCIYETKHKYSLKSHMLIHKDVTEVKTYKCSMCIYRTKHKYNLKSHMLIHRNITEVKMYMCSMCTFETKRKKSLVTHMLLHKDITEVEIFKCSKCIYETNIKSNLKSHMLIHKDITEVESYKCSMCIYKTSHVNNFKSHMLIHKDITEVQMYK